jgi:hypothetical protein
MTPLASLAWANSYFSSRRLITVAWDNATNADQLKSLNQASDIINRFNYYGQKLDEAQEHEFPRVQPAELSTESTDTVATVPDAILRATAEIAYHLLDGWNPDIESDNLGLGGQGISSVRVTYDPNTTPPYKFLGLPSQMVWELLRPYIRDVGTLNVSRV